MRVTENTGEAELKDARILWLAKNRGALTEISDKFGLSVTTIRRVFYGEIASGANRVERELGKRGAPGFNK